jgi:hypothetical protein
MATGNDPVAGPGQVAPGYFYGLRFGFTSSPALMGHGSGPGDCPAQTTLEHAGVWARYRVGAL